MSKKKPASGIVGFACPVLVIVSTLTASTEFVYAYSDASAVSDPCHETITLRAIAAGSWPIEGQPRPLDDRETRIADDSIFELPEDFRDPWSLAAVQGVRHVDVRGHELTDLPAIAVEAAKPERQREHCLRAPSHDGSEGDRQALTDCRAFILEQVELALGSGEVVDMEAQETFEITLTFRGAYDTDLNRFAFRMGMALHALQDAFSHSFRAETTHNVVHVLNYADGIKRDYDGERDGHAHLRTRSLRRRNRISESTRRPGRSSFGRATRCSGRQ